MTCSGRSSLAVAQGRNAVYLATKGWDVTGFDIFEVGFLQWKRSRKAKEVSPMS